MVESHSQDGWLALEFASHGTHDRVIFKSHELCAILADLS